MFETTIAFDREQRSQPWMWFCVAGGFGLVAAVTVMVSMEAGPMTNITALILFPPCALLMLTGLYGLVLALPLNFVLYGLLGLALHRMTHRSKDTP